MLLSFDIAPEAIEEHDRWHTQEHLPERLSIPGFLRGTRWTATSGEPRYMVLYEVRDLQVLTSEAYLSRLDNPTPWTRRMMPSYRGMSRGLCAVVGSFGYGQGGTAALIRFACEETSADNVQHWLMADALPKVPQTPGLGSAHLLRGAQAAPMTNEQRIRGADRGVDSAIIITGYDGTAVAECARSLCASDPLSSPVARQTTRATYVTSYVLSRSEIDTQALDI